MIRSIVDSNQASHGGGLLLTGGYIMNAQILSSTVMNNRKVFLRYPFAHP